jgi:hypothetical protein
MRVFTGSACVLVLACTFSAGPMAQGAASGAPQGAQNMPPQGGGGRQMGGGPDAARVTPGGGVLVSGWAGKIDAAEAANGQVLNNSNSRKRAPFFHVETGPATTYWNPSNRATGNYTVKATFTERQAPLAVQQDDGACGHEHPDARRRPRTGL